MHTPRPARGGLLVEETYSFSLSSDVSGAVSSGLPTRLSQGVKVVSPRVGIDSTSSCLSLAGLFCIILVWFSSSGMEPYSLGIYGPGDFVNFVEPTIDRGLFVVDRIPLQSQFHVAELVDELARIVNRIAVILSRLILQVGVAT